MANYVSLDMDLVSSAVNPSLETSTSFISLQVPTRSNIPFSELEENRKNRHSQHEDYIGTSEWFGRPEVQIDGEQNLSDVVECRICQEEDKPCNLEIPCSCCGSMKYAHHQCLQRWCNEKREATCEICNQPYKNGYIIPTILTPRSGNHIEISGEWSNTDAVQSDYDVLAIAAAEEFGQYAAINTSAAACIRAAVLLLMAILVLRHAFAMESAHEDEDAATVFALFLLRAAGFLLPCYIMARAMNIVHRRRQRQDVARATTEVAFLLRGRNRGVIFAVPSRLP